MGVYVNSNPKYTSEDDEYIINHTIKECAEHFPDRSYDAIYQRKRALTPPDLFERQKLEDMKSRARFKELIPVDQFTIDGQFVATFPSIAEA